MTVPSRAAEPQDHAGGGGSFGVAAEALLDQLITTARPRPDGPTWPGRAVVAESDGRSVTGGPVDDDLYAGRAGIAWVLAQTPGGCELALAALHGAVGRCLATRRSLPDVGLLTGATGIAVVADEVGRRLDDTALVAQARQLGADVAGAASERAPGTDLDLLHGGAGTLCGLLRLFGPDDPVAATACRSLGAALIDHVEALHLCGLSRGASGAALALEELGLATGDERYVAAADAGVRYERTFYSPMHGWPDLRTDTTGAASSYPASWCRGAVGIGLARLASYARRGDLVALAEASAAIGFARNWVMATVSVPDAVVDSSLCHGLAGAVELFLVAWEVTGAPEHLAAARRTGGLMMARAEAADGRYGSGLLDRSPTPGLFLGVAGVAATLLRLQDPRSWPSAATFPWSGGSRPSSVPGVDHPS